MSTKDLRTPLFLTEIGQSLNFHELQVRLLACLRDRVRAGEMTERGISRACGISQPHIHNVLKGKRYLSLEMSDLLLLHLHVDIRDLLEPDPPDCDPN
jgi:hypothetical protein